MTRPTDNVVPFRGRTRSQFAGRTDAGHVLSQLPDLGGPDKARPEFMAAVDAWTPAQGGLVLCGPTGSGKSTAARLLVLRLLDEREDATSTMWVLARDLATSPELAERARRVRLLVLDDLGQESDHECTCKRCNDAKAALFAVLDHRHTRFPTIVTTGIRKEELGPHPDERGVMMLQGRYSGALARRLGEFRGRAVQVVDVFKRPPRPRPPSDQEELARRQGETL